MPWTHRSLTWRVGTWKHIALCGGIGALLAALWSLYLGWTGVTSPIAPWEVCVISMSAITVVMSLKQSDTGREGDSRAVRNAQLLLNLVVRADIPLDMALWLILDPVISHRIDLGLYGEHGSTEKAEETLRSFYKERGFGSSQCQSGHGHMCRHRYPEFSKWIAGESKVNVIDLNEILEEELLEIVLGELDKRIAAHGNA